MASITRYSSRRRSDSAMEIADTGYKQRRSCRRSFNNTLDIKSLGVCTGSGLNHLSCALVQYRQDAPNSPLRLQILRRSEIPIHPTNRLSILNTLRAVQSQPLAMAQFNTQLGLLFANGIKTFCHRHGIALESIDLIGTHSATVPAARRRSPGGHGQALHPFSWNGIITAETKITTIFDFAVMEYSENRPLASPISPIAFIDRLILRHRSKFRACLNISELASINFIPPLVKSDAHNTISRYCGPGSLLIDYAVAHCTSNNYCEDDNGSYARHGNINQDIVERFLRSHDYLRSLPPLSIAREMFGDHDGQRLLDECVSMGMSEADTIATITRITAQNIVTQYRRLLAHYFPSGQQVDELFICGASAQNSNIVDYLKAELSKSTNIKPLDDIGIPGEANDAVCYAHLALETALTQATLPTTASSSSSSFSSSSSLSSSSIPPSDAIDARIRATILRGEEWEDLSARIVRFSAGKQLHLNKDVRCVGNLETALNRLGLY
ncbi:hypothetical protein J1614_001964, partial [Plenodomus biglobosus]